jgi:beta-alanine degradation protein BauB
MRSATAILQTETPEVRITEWRLPPDSAIGWHRHEYDYVVVPITDGELTIVTDARTRSPITAGQAYFRKAGVEHDVLNETGWEIVFVEIELKLGVAAYGGQSARNACPRGKTDSNAWARRFATAMRLCPPPHVNRESELL